MGHNTGLGTTFLCFKGKKKARISGKERMMEPRDQVLPAGCEGGLYRSNPLLPRTGEEVVQMCPVLSQ